MENFLSLYGPARKMLVLIEYAQSLGRSYIYTKNASAYTFGPKYGIFYHSPDGFLMLCVQNVCVEPILIPLNPILIEFVMMLVSPPHRHPLIIYHQLMPEHFINYHYQKLPHHPMQILVNFEIEGTCVISGSHQRRMPRFKSARKAPSFLFTFPKMSRSPK